MAFVGIVVDKKEENLFENKLNEIFSKLEQKNTIILINDTSVENIKNVKFEIVLIDNCKTIKNLDKLRNIIQNTSYLVINTDNCNTDIIKGIELTVISYGFNTKATITMSSVEEEKMIFCIQRNIKNLRDNIIEAQEIDIKIQEESSKYLEISTSIIEILYK